MQIANDEPICTAARWKYKAEIGRDERIMLHKAEKKARQYWLVIFHADMLLDQKHIHSRILEIPLGLNYQDQYWMIVYIRFSNITRAFTKEC